MSSDKRPTPGKSLLDETLVVASSEFGRTTYVKNAAGRDHHDQVFTSALVGVWRQGPTDHG